MTEIGEGAHIGLAKKAETAEGRKEKCKRIYLHAFRGDRNRAFLLEFKERLRRNKEEGAPGPTDAECLVYTGHVGISFEAQSPIYGFNPNTGDEPVWKVFETLKGYGSYPGKITDDTAAFNLARGHGLTVEVIEYIYPESEYNRIKQDFDAEKAGTKLRYSFPGGTGDCNCATWPANIGVLLPSAHGRMDAYISAMGEREKKQKLGDCEG